MTRIKGSPDARISDTLPTRRGEDDTVIRHPTTNIDQKARLEVAAHDATEAHLSPKTLQLQQIVRAANHHNARRIPGPAQSNPVLAEKPKEAQRSNRWKVASLIKSSAYAASASWRIEQAYSTKTGHQKASGAEGQANEASDDYKGDGRMMEWEIVGCLDTLCLP